MCDNVDGWQTRYKSDWKYVLKSHFNFFGKVLFQFIGSESMSKWDFVFTNNGAREKGKESKADSYLLNYFMLLIELRCCSGAINFCREYLCRFYKAENAKISCWWNNSIPGFFLTALKVDVYICWLVQNAKKKIPIRIIYAWSLIYAENWVWCIILNRLLKNLLTMKSVSYEFE